MKRRSILFALSTAATLSACGFQLRGSNLQSALPFETIHVSSVGSTGLAYELHRRIQTGGGVQVVDDPKSAEAIVDILGETRDRGTATLNTQGRIREYSLFYRVRFRVRGPDDQTLLAPTEIVLKRDMSYNESQAIAKEKEEEMLFRNMQSDAVQQVLRRISALRPSVVK